ncbi:sulfotransferase [Micromonospora sp. NPDC047793]|uniref:sulfotransferase family protein n=1 Tax=Micromonospora sp. NPDC047793 TaxID=3154342 RepID=UPI0033E74918
MQMVGTQRSGSNLVRLMLGGLPGVLAPPSAHKLRDFQDLWHRYEPLSEPVNRKRLISDLTLLIDLNALAWQPGSLDPVRATRRMLGNTLAHAVLAIYDTVALDAGCSAWVSKCLENVHYADQLLATGAEITFLHLVRDPRDVALSFLRSPIGPKDPRAVALRWLQDQEAARTARTLAGPNNWLEIRYEDVLAAPAEALAPTCEMLRVPWDDGALSFYRRPEAVGAPDLSVLWVNLDRPVDPSRAGDHLRTTDTEFIAAIEELTADAMRAYGYVPRYHARARVPSLDEIQEIYKTDRRLRAAANLRRDPTKEYTHKRRYEFLDALRRKRPWPPVP